MATTKTKRETVVGVFQTRAEADRAVDELRRAGFREDQIGVVARNAEGEIKSDKGDTYAGEGAVAGVLAGAGVGGLVGLGVLAGVIPAIGPAIAAGALGAVLLNAAGGAAIGGVVGALVGMGIPEEDATWYEGELKAGRYLVTVNAANRYDEAWRILHGHGAYNRQHAMATSTTTSKTMATGTAAHTATGEKTMQVREEELHARKVPVEKGEVKVRKEVVTEHKTIDVPVTREEVVIERRPASGRASSADLRPGEEVRIPVKEEQVRVEKEAVVKEEVRVGKRQVTETEHVAGDVKKEKVKIETEGEVDVCSTDDATKKGRGRSKS